MTTPRKATILVVDDEVKIRELVGSLLEQEGYEVMTASGVDDAIARLEARPVDLVVTDLRMPERSGLDLLREMRRRHAGVASVIVTGHASTDSAIDAIRLGVSDYLKKPFGLDALLRTVEGSLASRDRRREQERWQRSLRQEEGRATTEARLESAIDDTQRRIREIQRSLTRRSAMLELLESIQNEAGSKYDLPGLLDRALERVCTELGARKGSILLVEEEGPQPRLRVAAVQGEGRDFGRGLSLPVDGGVARWIVAHRRSLRVDDVSREPRFEWRRRERYASPSFVSVPMVTGDQIVGVLNLNDPVAAGPFSADDERLARVVGSALAGAVAKHRLVQGARDHQLATTRALVDSLEAKDPHIRGHSSRVTQHALRLAEVLGLPEEERRILYYGGHLHDIGKIGVPERILQKPGSLSDDEFRAVALHPEIGARLLRRLRFLDEVKPIVRHHHERWDGRGYPDRLEGDEIPRLASVVSVADAFDAMTSGRSYREARHLEEAREEIRRHRGTQFRPDVVDAFLELRDFRRRPASPAP